MWMMPLHVNQKSDYDDDMIAKALIRLHVPHCWKSHVAAQLAAHCVKLNYGRLRCIEIFLIENEFDMSVIKK